MAFQSAKFFMLLLGTLALYYIVPAKAKNLVLLAAGVIFYASAGPGYLALLAGAILLSYAGGLLLGRLQAGKGRRAVFIGALVLLFGNQLIAPGKTEFSKALSIIFAHPDHCRNITMIEVNGQPLPVAQPT